MDMTRHLPAIVLALLVSGSAWALQPTTDSEGAAVSQVAQKAFFKEELTISSQNVPLDQLRQQLGTAKDKAWSSFFQKHGQDTQVYLDPRSGTPTKIQLHLPLIPDDGVGNRVSLQSVGQQLGIKVSAVDELVVGQAVLKFVNESVDVLGIDPAQLGE